LPGRQLLFVLALARGAGVEEAARQVGQTRQNAYQLRKKAGAAAFAAAWDAAVDFAVRARTPRQLPVGAMGGIETLLVPRFYRGRLIGFVEREDVAGAMRTLARLDRLAERFDRDGVDLEAGLAWFERLAEATERDERDAMPQANVSELSCSGRDPGLDAGPLRS
jgi:hypothetical protein